VSSIEIAFFGLAVLIPLIGGATLLYFLARSSKGDRDPKEK
jgi:hypothetical protein